MSAALHLAKPGDLDRLMALVAAFHAHQGIEQDETRTRAALEPLLEGSPLGAVYLVGPSVAPIGYVVVTFGWSIEMGGMDAFIDEIYIRESVRGRGIGTEALVSLAKALAGAGVMALHFEVDRADTSLHGFYGRAGFVARDRYMLMTRKLA